jgi:hypothetical protein
VGALAAGEHRLVEEQLFEGEPCPGALDVVLALREVDRPDRVGDPRQPPSRPQRRRQRLDQVRRPADRLLDPLPDPGGLELLGRRVDGDQAVALLPLGREDLVLGDPEAAFVPGAGEQQGRAGLELLGDPGLVEPGGAQVAGVVADFD